MRFKVDVFGDVAGVVQLPDHLKFAASRATNQTLVDAQAGIIEELKDEFEVRKPWYKPRTRYGINVRFATPKSLDGSVGTAADWLLEAEGYNQGVKEPEGGSRLSQPDTENTRFGIKNVVRRDQKAFRLLAQGNFSSLGNKKEVKKTGGSKGAFIKKGKYGHDLLFQRVSADAQGNVRRSAKTNRPLRSRKEAKNTRLVLKHVLKPSVRVPKQPVVTSTGVKTFYLKYAPHLTESIVIALRTARMK